MKSIAIALLFLLGFNMLSAQDLSFSRPGKKCYKEMDNPATPDLKEWSALKKPVNVSFASDNIRYPKEKVPTVELAGTWKPTAWKGEKIHTQILVWSKTPVKSLRWQTSDLRGPGGAVLRKEHITAAFVRYVMSDEFEGGCSHQNKVYDSSLVADPIDIVDQLPMEANTVRPIWLTIRVPAELPAGVYNGKVTVIADKPYALNISLNILDHTLPPPSEWSYDLDLWQYADPIAKMHDVSLWSEEHFELMRPYFTTLAAAGQKVLTANIIEQPWGLTHVHFDDPSLIKWTKRKDGSWNYDFSLFDRYVSFVMSCGINKRINCYTMITWDGSYIFYDESKGENSTIVLKPGTDDFNAFWSPMLREFTQHLKSKGWFDIAAIAMDERPIESMKGVIALLKQIDPAWKIALAADEYHSEFGEDIYDYSIASYLNYDAEVLQQRKALRKPTTYYTACVEEHPGPYTFSPPAENAWLGWFAAAKGYTGYLFWAYNTWVKNPLQDARWRRYPSGTLFQFYPGPRTSIRFEKLIEGIQDFEKIRILKEQFAAKNEKEKLAKLNEVLAAFEIKNLETVPAAQMIRDAKLTLNQF